MKHIIEFREDSFNIAKEEHHKKMEASKELDHEIQVLTGHKGTIDKKGFFENPMSMVYKLIEDKYIEKNTLGLSGKKLAEMLELRVNPVIAALEKYSQYKDIEDPVKENYTTYAETPDEIEKLKKIKKAIGAINDLSKITHVYANHIVQGTSGAITADLRDTRLRPNVSWIKGTNRV